MKVIVPHMPPKRNVLLAALATMGLLTGNSAYSEKPKVTKKHREPRPITQNREKVRRLRQIEKGMLKI